MGDRFVCLVKTRCLSFSSASLLPSHIPPPPSSSSSSSRTLHNNNKLRIRTKPRPPHSSSTSHLELISTVDCSDGSVVFRFGDESERAAAAAAAIDAQVVEISELSEDLAVGSNVDESEISVSKEEVGDTATSSYSQDVLTEGKTHSTDDSAASNPRELRKDDDSERHPSTNSEFKSTEGKAHRTDVLGLSAPKTVELRMLEVSERCPPESEDEFREAKAHRSDVSALSATRTVELHMLEGSEGCASESGDALTGVKAQKTDGSGASNAKTVEFNTVDGSEMYPSKNLEDESIENITQIRDAGESTLKPVELKTVEGSDGYPSTNLEYESTEHTPQRRDVSGASTPKTVEQETVEGSERYLSTNSEDELIEDKAHSRYISGASTAITEGLHKVERTVGYPSLISEKEVTDGEAQKRELQTAEGAEVSASTLSEDEFTEGIAHRRDVGEALNPRLVEFDIAEGTEGEDNSAALLLSSSAAVLPNPSTALTGGEDSYFIASGNWLGVADGISQWSLEGIIPGTYARELMENCERFLSDCKGIPLSKPEHVLIASAIKVRSPGSCTGLVAYFDGQALHVANVGDSGFIIIRNGAVFKRSSPMVHGFNFPLQIVRGHNPSELIERYQVDLDEGDVIVTATDGFFENLYEQEIASIVAKSLKTRMRLQDLAEFLATSAQEVGKSTSRRSPFADAVEASGYVGYTGGKLDDVTVIVSYVQKKSNCYSQ